MPVGHMQQQQQEQQTESNMGNGNDSSESDSTFMPEVEGCTGNHMFC